MRGFFFSGDIMSLQDFKVRPALENDLKYVDHLQRKNAEDLAFYPRAAFEREIKNQRIVLAEYNAEPCGYMYHGSFRGEDLKIHRACIQYDLRGQLYGAALVRHIRDLADLFGCTSISLRCGSDIAANGFWKTMGFVCTEITPGGVRRMRDINHWRLALSDNTTGFVGVEPSSKEKDAGLWRRNKGEKQSQFMRGDSILRYREALLEKEKLR